jgi:hypothetical protein
MYNFRKDEEDFQLGISRTATIADVVERIANRFDVDAEGIALLFRGKAFKSHLVLSRQRIPPDSVILVYIPDLAEILVKTQVSVKLPTKMINVFFLRRGAPSLSEEIMTRQLIREVKMNVGPKIGLGVDDFDLIYKDAAGRGVVLPEASLVSETAILDGSRVLIHLRAGDQPGELAPGSSDPWEQEILELLPGEELIKLRRNTEQAVDIDLIIAIIVQGGLEGLRGM